MIVNCTDCGKAISTRQDRCPYCQVINEQNAKYAPRKKGLTSFLFHSQLFSRK